MAAPLNSLAPRSRGLASTGLIVLDSRAKPIYFNAEAFQVLSYPHSSGDFPSLMNSLPHEIRRVLADACSANVASLETELKSGKRSYRCRVCPLIRNPRDPLKVSAAVILDRNPAKSVSVNVNQIAEGFNLTAREQETVRLLTEGLTSKEIAARMHISPNTVKTFVHLIMTKMAVPTRSAILGKLLRS